MIQWIFDRLMSTFRQVHARSFAIGVECAVDAINEMTSRGMDHSQKMISVIDVMEQINKDLGGDDEKNKRAVDKN